MIWIEIPVSSPWSQIEIVQLPVKDTAWSSPKQLEICAGVLTNIHWCRSFACNNTT